MNSVLSRLKPPDMPLPTAPYPLQLKRWPTSGRRIMACHDAATIVVYQAYGHAIADHVLAHGVLGGAGFSWDRMSWIKPGFLWMMFRAGWATKPAQERVLAFRITQTFFDRLLADAVPSTYGAHYPTREAWMAAGSRTDVRLQWDPDHTCFGHPTPRRALQLGLRREALAAFGRREIAAVVDMTLFVRAQHAALRTRGAAGLATPVEQVYMPADPDLADRLGLTPPDNAHGPTVP